jgi:hypothetical protein
MVLLQMVIQVTVRPVDHMVPEVVPNGTRVGIEAIRGDAIWGDTGHDPGGAKKGLSRCSVACLTQAHVDELAVLMAR